MAHKPSTKEQALLLRTMGYSYSYISLKTGLPKSTLCDWLARVPYTPNPETVEKIGKARAAANQQKSVLKQENFLLARREAAERVRILSERDLFMFGLGLYLGEGSKTNDIVRIANSDPKVICLAIAWFRSLGLSLSHLAVTLHLYPDSDVKECIDFWSKTTGIPKSQFLKIQIDWRKDKKVYKLGKLPYGTAHVGVRSLGDKRFGVFLSRKILACIEEVGHKVLKRGRGLPV